MDKKASSTAVAKLAPEDKKKLDELTDKYKLSTLSNAITQTSIGQEEIEAVDAIISEYGVSTLSNDPARVMADSLRMSVGIKKLYVALSPAVMDQVIALKNSKLGFLTDENTEAARGKIVRYSKEQLKTPIIEALLRGARLVGNEMNVIGANCYLTKEYFVRRVKEYPGLTGFDPHLSVPKLVDGKTVVKFKATWKLSDKPMELEGEIPIRVNKYMGDDAILGKATRKMMHRIYCKLTGSEWPEGEVTDFDSALPADASVMDTGDPFTPGQHSKQEPQARTAFDKPTGAAAAPTQTTPAKLKTREPGVNKQRVIDLIKEMAPGRTFDKPLKEMTYSALCKIRNSLGVETTREKEPHDPLQPVLDEKGIEEPEKQEVAPESDFAAFVNNAPLSAEDIMIVISKAPGCGGLNADTLRFWADHPETIEDTEIQAFVRHELSLLLDKKQGK